MMALAVAIASLLLAAVACFTFLENLKIYLPAPAGGTSDLASPAISVLIPARNEEANILAAVQSALDAAGGEERVRVLVADDHSTDRTAELVAELAKRDGRVALISVPPLPAGWNGKQHACFVLAQAAQTEWLLFMDADVRMEPGSIARMRAELDGRVADSADSFCAARVSSDGENATVDECGVCGGVRTIIFVPRGGLPEGGRARGDTKLDA
jgi:cellulose synthase/poly-beta-1,6-N-acetylglucosamine synthase-like glycosyltransferase